MRALLTALAICTFAQLCACKTSAYDVSSPVQPNAIDGGLPSELDDLVRGKGAEALPVQGSNDGTGYDPFRRSRAIEATHTPDVPKTGSPACTPPFTTDDAGVKRYKKECL